MSVYYKKTLNTDEFGNMYFTYIKFYEFDKYLFEHIKSFLFSNKKRKKCAILHLSYNSKYKIINQKKYGLYIHSKSFQDYTENETIQITPSILELNVATDKVFINYTIEKDVYICDIYDNIPQAEEQLICYAKLRVQFDGTIIPTFNIHASTYLLKTNKKLATIYVNKKYSYLIKDIINKDDEKIFYKFYKPIYKNLTEAEVIKLNETLDIL